MWTKICGEAYNLTYSGARRFLPLANIQCCHNLLTINPKECTQNPGNVLYPTGIKILIHVSLAYFEAQKS